ncbi:MAG TPA: DUF1730 domain-containing protein [Oscillospiraceae bacterium]|nr:DUF1730 domain-containing protein [Oscillospiraceae bacterium]
MSSAREIKALLLRQGAAAAGVTSFSSLEPFLSPDALARVRRACPSPAGVVVAAFPYYAGAGAGNLSLYARGLDYHLALSARLDAACRDLRERFPGRTFVCGADNSPLPERAAARLAGVGIMGLNGLTIVPPYGSYVFLGTVTTDLPLEADVPPAPNCRRCGVCARACPTGALSPDGSFDPSKCLSDLTQKRGVLSSEEEALLRAHPLIWGCDFCQRACPYNRDAEYSTLPEFLGEFPEAPLIPSLCEADLAGLSDRTFREKFRLRAFAWRGLAPLRRNLALHNPK